MSTDDHLQSLPQVPFPKFYICRPDKSKIPLIAVDELPSWLQIAKWPWGDISKFEEMQSVSPLAFAREGEYDLVCYNCCPNMDALHMKSSSSGVSYGGRPTTPLANSKDAVVPRGGNGYFSDPGNAGPPNYTPGAAMGHQRFSFACPPPFSHLQKPFVGMCLVDLSQYPIVSRTTGGPTVMTLPDSCGTTALDDGRKTALNPEAPAFSPSISPDMLPRPPQNVPAVDSPVILPLPAAALVKKSYPHPSHRAPPAPSSPKDRQYSRKNIEETLAELRKKLGIGEIREDVGPEKEKWDIEMVDAQDNQPPARKAHSVTQRRGKNIRKVRRAQAAVRRIERNGVRNADPRSENSAGGAKRRNKGKKRNAKGKACSNSRYWHMMRIPNWRAQAPLRGGQ